MWSCFRTLQRQVLWNGNIDAETHKQDFVAENQCCRWKPMLALKNHVGAQKIVHEMGPYKYLHVNGVKNF